MTETIDPVSCTFAIIVRTNVTNVSRPTASDEPDNTFNAPAVNTYPVPARNPPVTGDGNRRTMFPSLYFPSKLMITPVLTVVHMIAASSVGSLAVSSMPSVP